MLTVLYLAPSCTDARRVRVLEDAGVRCSSGHLNVAVNPPKCLWGKNATKLIRLAQ